MNEDIDFNLEKRLNVWLYFVFQIELKDFRMHWD